MTLFHGFRPTGGAGPMYVFEGSINDSGRKIYVDDASKAAKFAAVINAQGPHAAKRIRQHLVNMRATAGGLRSFSSEKNAAEHMDFVGRTRIKYQIFQAGTPHRPPGIYITDIDYVKNPEKHPPGLYSAKYTGKKLDDGWEVDEKPRDQIHTHFAGVNGLTKGLTMAATAILPDMIKNAYNKAGEPVLTTVGYTLMFNPPSLYSGGTRWTTPEEKTFTLDFAASRLAAALVNSQKRGHEVRWVAHGNGDVLFSAALKKTGAYILDKHTVLFAAPREDLVEVLRLVKAAGMKLHEKVYVYHPDDWSMVRNRLLKGGRIADAIEAFGDDYANRAGELRETFSTDAYTAITKTAGVGAMASGAYVSTAGLSRLGLDQVAQFDAWKELMVSDGYGATAMMYGGAAMTVWGTMRGLKRLRNSTATNIPNPDLNPHMHPFKNREGFDAHIKDKAGGTLKSFTAILTATRA